MYKLQLIRQFRKMQSTIAYRENEKGEEIEIFYSYTCPKLVNIEGNRKMFSFEGSRKDGAIISSKTTSKQCNKFLGFNHKNLNKINLKTFEDLYFDTRIEKYY